MFYIWFFPETIITTKEELQICKFSTQPSDQADTFDTFDPAATATGPSKMAAFGALLAANYTIVDQENTPEYPITRYEINVPVLLAMFTRIIFEIARSINCELGAPNLSKANDLALLRNISASVAWDAVVATYVVLYNKGSRYDTRGFANMTTPPLVTTEFPIYLSALINSFGPIQSDGLPARRTHVPFILDTALTANIPAGYQSHLSARFREKYGNTKYLVGAVNHNGQQSSGWWLFRPVTIDLSTVTDDCAANLPALPNLRLFSPFKFDQTEHYLKIGTLYALGPLTNPGCAPFSTTPWYTRVQLNNFQGNLPTFDIFPAATRADPYFWTACSAFHAILQIAIFELTAPDADGNGAVPRGIIRGQDGQPAAQRPRAAAPTDTNEPQDVTSVPDGPTAGFAIPPITPNQEIRYRILYMYYDHIAITRAGPVQYQHWVTELVTDN